MSIVARQYRFIASCAFIALSSIILSACMASSEQGEQGEQGEQVGEAESAVGAGEACTPGNAITPPQYCNTGITCCTTGIIVNDGICRDLTNDAQNCGACGNDCGYRVDFGVVLYYRCVDGVCGF